MRLHVYRGDQLAAVFVYGQEPTYHGGAGAEVKRVVEAGRIGVGVPEAGVSDVPREWLQWIASIVFPALSSGAFVRWYA
jgi:hypothetical protein